MVANTRYDRLERPQIQKALAKDLLVKAAEVADLPLGMTLLERRSAHAVRRFMPEATR